MDPKDEFFHIPTDAEFWNESHYLDFVGEDLQGHFRIGFYPNRGEADLFGFLIENDAIYSVHDASIPLDQVHGLSIHHPDWHFAMTPIDVGRTWTVEFNGKMLQSETPAEVANTEGTTVGVDVSFTSRGRHEPFLYSKGKDDFSGPGSDRYELTTYVEGTAVIANDSRDFDGPGERDHSWGVRDWTEGEWLWISGSFEDGTAFNHLSAWPPGGDPVILNGFWFDGEQVHPLTEATMDVTPPFGVDTTLQWISDGDAPSISLDLAWNSGQTSLAVDPFATTPVKWVDEDREFRSVMNRSPARQMKDGVIKGRGFLENMTQVPLE